MYAEVLACNIRANPRIKGLCLPGSSDPLSPISQYADDTSLVVCTDEAIRACFAVYDTYERGSGSKLNLSKSKGLWLGPWVNRSDPPVALEWSSVKIKVLGVFLGPGNLDDDNWKPRIAAVENTLSSWRQRILSWSATWRQLSVCPVDRSAIDVAWQVAHGVLYTADRLISFGYDYDPNCFCGSPETPSHLFFECALAQSILGWIQSLMFRASSLCPSLLCRHVLFGFSASELAVVPRVFVYLLNLAKYFLWRAHNDYRFRDVQPGALPLIEVVKARAKCHLCIFFKRFRSPHRQRYFHRQWGANSVVGRVSEGSFYFRL